MIYKYRNSKKKCDNKLKPKKRTILKGWDEGTTVQAFPFKKSHSFLTGVSVCLQNYLPLAFIN
jgi:hypothetical protein